MCNSHSFLKMLRRLVLLTLYLSPELQTHTIGWSLHIPPYVYHKLRELVMVL